MLNFNSLLRSALVAMILVVASGDPGEKLATCCKKVTKTEIKEPILDFLMQKANGQCVNAVIFQTQTGLYCSHIKAPWVLRKIREFRKTKAQQNISSGVGLSPSRVSLLSIITSTASPPFPSTIPPSFSSPLLTSDSIMSSGDMSSGEMSSGDMSSGAMSSGDMSSGSSEDQTIV